MFRLTVHAQSPERLISKLDASLYAASVRTAFRAALDLIYERARGRAPGNLSASLTSTMDSRPVPTWARVAVSAEHNGFRYPWALQGSRKVKFHYRSGPNAGKLTIKWMSGALRGMKRTLDEFLLQAAENIERAWSAL